MVNSFNRLFFRLQYLRHILFISFRQLIEQYLKLNARANTV